MEHPDLDNIETQILDQWFSTIVNDINFDLQVIEAAVVALGSPDLDLTNVDTAPIGFLKESLNKLVADLNKGFDDIIKEFETMDRRIRALEGKQNGVV